MGLKKVRDVNHVPRFLQSLERLTRFDIEVGIFREDDPQLLLVATVHEYGAASVGIPERSFMRAAWESGLAADLDRLIQKELARLHTHKRPEQLAEAVGELCVREVQAYMHRLKQPPLKQPNNNPSNNPLVNTGALQGAVTYKIRKR